MQTSGLKYSFLAFLSFSLFLVPSVSWAVEATGDKNDLMIEQKSDQKTEQTSDPKAEAKPGMRTGEKTGSATEAGPALKSKDESGSKAEAKPVKKEGPFQLWKRWDTDTYSELDLILDHYWGSFGQVIKGDPIGAMLRRGGDWKYVAFHFDLGGAYAGSLKSSTAAISNGSLGYVNMIYRLNGVLPVLYGVMLQAGIMNETWAEYTEYETLYRKEVNIYVIDGLGPDIMLSFSPIKHVSLNFEYSQILLPLIEKHFFANYLRGDDFDADEYSVSDTGFYTIEVGISARPLKNVALGFTYGEKKSSHQATYKDNDHPQNNRTAEYKNLNDYLLVSLIFTW